MKYFHFLNRRCWVELIDQSHNFSIQAGSNCSFPLAPATLRPINSGVVNSSLTNLTAKLAEEFAWWWICIRRLLSKGSLLMEMSLLNDFDIPLNSKDNVLLLSSTTLFEQSCVSSCTFMQGLRRLTLSFIKIEVMMVSIFFSSEANWSIFFFNPSQQPKHLWSLNTWHLVVSARETALSHRSVWLNATNPRLKDRTRRVGWWCKVGRCRVDRGVSYRWRMMGKG